MPSPITLKGKAKGPGFVDNLSNASPVKKRNIPAILGIVLVGVAVILFLKTRQGSTTVATGTSSATGGTYSESQSGIDNLTQALLAFQGLQPGNTTNPGGGTTTPITEPPVTTNPPSGNTVTNPADKLPTSYSTAAQPDPTGKHRGVVPFTDPWAAISPTDFLAKFPIPTSIAGKTTPTEWKQLVMFLGKGPNRTVDLNSGVINAERFVASGQNVGGPNQPKA